MIDMINTINKPNLACGPELNVLGHKIGRSGARSAFISLVISSEYQKIEGKYGCHWWAIRDMRK